MMKLQRHFKDIGIGGITARWYDNNTRKSRLAEMKAYAKEVDKHIQDGCSVLEVAPGPGYLAIELAKLGKCKKIIGLDISKDFVEIARRNAKEAGVLEVEFRQGNVADIPFPDNKFDFIICTAAFKNFKDPFVALSQI
jgi:ubiquinone/menaquinone biosynthesis C-methylase UbiE